jgi:hypothetical protein
MKMKKIMLFGLILFISTPIIKSQVTIGSSIDPVKGALLDLKTKDADASTNETVEGNKNGGVILPRVKLVNGSTLEPLIATDSNDWSPANQDQTKKAHTGMMVYNLTDTGDFLPGAYVWDGAQWLKEIVNANNGLTNSGDTIRLGGTLLDSTVINQAGYALNFVGGTGNTNGKIYLSGVKDNVPANTDSIITMGIDNHTGELFAMKTATGGATTKAVNYVIYQLKGNGDWIKNFNTKIQAADYTLVIVGTSLTTATENAGISGPLSESAVTYVSSVYADTYQNAINMDEWIIHADYVGGSTTDKQNAIWTIYCLVINNALVNSHENNPIPFLYGTEDIDALQAPSGLQ